MEETKLKAWAEELKLIQLPRWDELPELELYMDQVITIVDRYLSPLIEDEKHPLLSSAMVNNYVKHKLVPPPVKKRYNRNHLAYLIAITLLKQVFSIPNINELIQMQLAIYEPQEAYNNFCIVQEEKLLQITKIVLGEEVSLTRTSNDFYYLAMEGAVASFTQKMLAEKIIQLDKEQEGEKNE
ncbi:MAG: DUF1836 domain-containing protein [Enterococcus viikkiensis]|uniref:DUF1836 domain-containing protein n=1 Tax=Enterococcus viikkiensis TaxID=930854 RepID=A0ABU3FQ30_9ENTE|nr:DUF1836 domain-containing protein [Enterococcus viikkiensis]MDT2828070.1 DUF1836 domain-containing protein [Enterococcus viikkiensis]